MSAHGQNWVGIKSRKKKSAFSSSEMKNPVFCRLGVDAESVADVAVFVVVNDLVGREIIRRVARGAMQMAERERGRNRS